MQPLGTDLSVLFTYILNISGQGEGSTNSGTVHVAKRCRSTMKSTACMQEDQAPQLCKAQHTVRQLLIGIARGPSTTALRGATHRQPATDSLAVQEDQAPEPFCVKLGPHHSILVILSHEFSECAIHGLPQHKQSVHIS
eukprot:scaffold134860_cov22-Tisochrysis_lutea.AAC.1